MMNKALGGLMLALGLLPLQANAQDYPDGAVTVTVPFSPGGSNDTIARYMAEGLSELWGEPFVIENRPGGGTAVGAAHVANAAPDGMEILFVSGSYSINAASRSDLPFDPIADLQTVATAATAQIAVISGPRVTINSLEDLVREAGNQELFYATAGVGSQQHFFAAMLAEELGIEMTAVPYPGGAEGLLDLLGGRVDIVVGTVSGMLATIESGAVPVAILSDDRSNSLPDVPTVTELGYPGASTATYWTVMVPAGTPPEIAQQLNEGIVQVFGSEEGTAFLASLDAQPSAMTAEESQAFIANEITVWTDIAERLGIRGSN
jgi:tripartite-type tricarboxylate transporter receptor subunit TctC